MVAPDLPEWCFDEEETDDHYQPNEQPIQMPTLPSSHPKNNKNSRKRKHQQEEEEETNDDDSHVQEEEEDEEDDTTEDGASTSSSGHKKVRKKRKNENIRLDATFMKGVGGVILMTNRQKVNALQHTIQDMCEWKGSGFPGKFNLKVIKL